MKGIFTFFNENSSSQKSNAYVIPPEAENMLLSVAPIEDGGAVNIAIEGITDLEKDAWMPISAISRKGFKVTDEITEEGLYDIPVLGVIFVRLINKNDSGTVKAYSTIQ